LIIKLISGLLSIGHYRFSRRLPTYCLCWLLCKNSSSSYERIKNKQVTMLLSNQKSWKRYTLIL